MNTPTKDLLRDMKPRLPGHDAVERTILEEHAKGETLHERIRARAYEIYRLRAGAKGDAASDWLQAEREILRQNGTLASLGTPVRQAVRTDVADRAKIRGEALLQGDQE